MLTSIHPWLLVTETNIVSFIVFSILIVAIHVYFYVLYMYPWLQQVWKHSLKKRGNDY